MVDAVGYEESRGDVDRIVQMPHEDDDAEEGRYAGEEIKERLAGFPEDEGHKEGQSGMSREEEIAALREPPDPVGLVIHGDLGRKRAEMGQDDEAGTDEDEEGDALCGKGDPLFGRAMQKHVTMPQNMIGPKTNMPSTSKTGMLSRMMSLT